MGGLYTKLFKKRHHKKIVINGLDGAGKTTMLYYLRIGEVVTTIPTIGFNVEKVEYGNVSLTAWDMGSSDSSRPLWRQYYRNTDALVIMVDSTDRKRWEQLRDEMQRTLAEDALRGAVLLILANKQDLNGAADVTEVCSALGLDGHQGRTWGAFPCNARRNESLYEALDWLTDAMRGGPSEVPPPQCGGTSPTSTGRLAGEGDPLGNVTTTDPPTQCSGTSPAPTGCPAGKGDPLGKVTTSDTAGDNTQPQTMMAKLWDNIRSTFLEYGTR